jgi:hypothetical protein
MNNSFLFILFCVFNNSFASNVLSKNSEHIGEFIRDVNRYFGSDNNFVRNHNFKYSDIYNSQLKYQVVNAYLNNKILQQEEYLHKEIRSVYVGIQIGYICQFFLLFLEIVILVYILYLKLNKRSPNVTIQPIPLV